MANKHIEICTDNCPMVYGSTEQDVNELVRKQEGLGNTTEVTVKCLGVCGLVGSNYPDGSIANVRVSGGELNQAAGIAGRDSAGELRTSLLKQQHDHTEANIPL